MENITLSIDGKNISCSSGNSIMVVAEQHGIKIPRLCYHHDLAPVGACRLCLVEDDNNGRLMASCVTPVTQNMSILTDSPRIRRHRRNIVRLMMAEHPESCLFCSKGNRCELRRIAAQLGVGETNLYSMPNYKTFEQVNPFIVRDLSKCILCGKCIRADHELVVTGAIDYNLRGFRSRPATAYDLALENSSCTFCGTCVSMCPTGALSTKNTQYVGTPERESFSICGFCGVGCSLSMGVAGERVVEVNPSHLHDTVNGATLCVRGHFAHDYLNVSERLNSPMIRKDGELTPASWDEALDMIMNRFFDIKRKTGSQSVAFFGSSKCTNEENYLFQKIARVFLGTNNVDNGGYTSGRSSLSLIDEKTDGGCRVNRLVSLEKAEIIFLLGSDPAQSAPVVSYYLKRAAQKGIPLIVADPRRTEITAFSSIWLCLRPQSDLALINCLAALLCSKKAYDPTFIDRFTENFEAYRDSLLSFDVETNSRITGIDISTLEKAADLLRGKKIAFVVGSGIQQQHNGRQSMEALFNLSLMTGSFENEEAGFYFLTKENNQVGAWDMGVVPDALPGRRPLHDDSARTEWERAWQTKISPDRGLDIIRMIKEAEKGNLKALYIMGENPIRSLPQPGRVRKALENMDFIVAQDILTSETTDIADVVLPGAAFSEKGGSFTNLEGRIQNVKPVVPPPGDAKPDWEILCLLAEKMGGFEHEVSLQSIQEEIFRLIPMYQNQSGSGDDAWIKETSQKSLFLPDKRENRLSFSPVVALKNETFDDDYPFTAILGSSHYHLGSGTRTGSSCRIQEFGLKGEIEIFPEDGSKLDLHDGDTVRLSSRHGAVAREIRLERGLRSGLIFVPMAFNGNDVMNLIDLTQLGEPDSCGWKTCQVKLEKLEE